MPVFYDPESWSLYVADAPRSHAGLFGGVLNVFVCGAMQEPARMAACLGRDCPSAPAVARGFLRRFEGQGALRRSFMLPDPSDAARVLTGTVYLDLSPDELARLEAVERQGGLRRRIDLDVQVGEVRLAAISFVKA